MNRVALFIGVGPGLRAAPEKSAEPMLDPERMADAYVQLAGEDRSAWTLELDLRPDRERYFE